MASCAPGIGRTGRRSACRGRSVVSRPGSGLSEEPVPGVQAGRAGCRVVPLLPSRALRVSCGAPGVGLQAGEDGVADLPLQRAQGLFAGLAFGQFLVVVGAAVAVPVVDLGDCGHVDGVVEPPVPAPGQPVDLARAGGYLDRRGPVVRGEVVPAGEAGHVADVADNSGGDDRADAEQPGQAGAGRGHGSGEFLAGLADPGVDAAQVLQERRGELAARGRHRVRRRDLLENPGRAGRVDRLADAAGDQVTQHGVQPAHDLGAGPAQVPVPLGPDLQHRRVIIGPGLPDPGRAQRCDGHRPGIVGVVLIRVTSCQQPDPRAQLGRHIQHPLTGRQQLLGQQVAQPAGALNGPGPLRPGRGPGQQPLRLGGAGTDLQLTQRLLRRADRHRRVRGLVRVDPDHHCRHERPLPPRAR